jgi:hypothetical protein
MSRCPDCALLETRVAELERRLAQVCCERCHVADPVLRRCQHCERTLCLACVYSSDCPHNHGGHVPP